MREDMKGYIIDLDGTVYTGKTAIDGAAEAIRLLRGHDVPFVFLSNRGNYSARMCREKLAGMGVEVRDEELLLSSTVTARYLQRESPGSSFWALGEQGLVDELQLAGLQAAERPEDAQWLVITLHETVTYRDLNMAFRAVRAGARIIATNADKSFPGDDGDAIDVAGMIGAITHSTGSEVEVVIGKPGRYMAEAALEALGLPPELCMIVGDSVESDITLGRNAGIRTALVLTGSARADRLAELAPQPDEVHASLLQVLQGQSKA
ncbi:HAD-IIA family hydrolase [Paenibacillus sp. IB182496]|uniref:HAD-IIA family hydrolase n=2 Tax=Paenibacillus sabuli TaxID=2772509 RepID=A0A927BXW1_9BACL|nr:HAD-IIA family hydrolase [Paenibacillus sabuli]